MLRGQNGESLVQIKVLEQQLSLESPLNLKHILNPGQEFEILFQNYGASITGGNTQGSYWKLINGNGCTLLGQHDNNGDDSSRYKCTYPPTGPMEIKVQKVDSSGVRPIGGQKIFTIP